MSDKLSLVGEQGEKSKPWYAKGLHFSCTGCGRCCTGSPGYTWVSVEEIEAMAQYLGLSVDDFGSKYLRRIGHRYALLERAVTYDCILLKGKMCSVYPVRPTQCQTFPFWPGALKSAAAWQETASSCEGINENAALVPFDEIERERQRQENSDESFR
jgi:Fe-S-cluster containining protein